MVVHEAQSTSSGLLDLVHEHEAKMIVLEFVHSRGCSVTWLSAVSPPACCTAPTFRSRWRRGDIRTKPGEVVRRVTAAYSGTPDQGTIWVLAAATVAARVSMPDSDWRRLQFVRTRSTRPHSGPRGIRRSSPSGPRWSSARPTLPSRECVHCPKFPTSWNRLSAMAVTGPRRSRASSVDRGDVLTVGSSKAGPLARVFLGSRAAKIVRYSPVPVGSGAAIRRSTRIVDQAEAE